MVMFRSASFQSDLAAIGEPLWAEVQPIGVHPSGETVGNRYTCRLIEFTVQIKETKEWSGREDCEPPPLAGFVLVFAKHWFDAATH
jgi:hypothetical protein